jgi:hypothetical protein
VTIVFTKDKHPFTHKQGYRTQGYIKGYMPFVQVVKMEPAYQKQNGHDAGYIRGYTLSSYMLA